MPRSTPPKAAKSVRPSLEPRMAATPDFEFTMQDGTVISIQVKSNREFKPSLGETIADLTRSVIENDATLDGLPEARSTLVTSAADFTALFARSLSDEHDTIARLSRERRKVVLHALSQYAESLTTVAHDRDLRTQDLRTRAQVAQDAMGLITKAHPDQVDAVRAALAKVVAPDPDAWTDKQAEEYARFALHQLHGQLEAESYSTHELDEHGLSRQRLLQLRRARRILGLRVPTRRDFIYPRWQFGTDARPLPQLKEILRVAREAELDDVSLHLLMTNVEAGGDGRAPVQLLKRGDLETVLRIIRAANHQGA